MTEQYYEESINGKPAPLSLIANITTAPAAPGAVDTEAIWWASLATDAVITGSGGIEVAGDANVGSIIQFTAPGLYQVMLQTADLAAPAAPGVPLNILRGASVLPITAGNGYPAIDFFTLPGVEAVIFNADAAPEIATISATFRITNADLADPIVGVNVNRQLRFSYPAAQIPTLVPPATRLTVQRVSL